MKELNFKIPTSVNTLKILHICSVKLVLVLKKRNKAHLKTQMHCIAYKLFKMLNWQRNTSINKFFYFLTLKFLNNNICNLRLILFYYLNIKLNSL